jgi:hypothetical protein
LSFQTIKKSLQFVLLLSVVERHKSSMDVACLQLCCHLPACLHRLGSLGVGIEKFTDYALYLEEGSMLSLGSLFGHFLALEWQHPQDFGDVYILLVKVLIRIVKLALF